MAERFLLDASALLCLLDDKPGADRVAEVLDHAAVTAVTVTKVAAEIIQRGASREEAAALLGALHLNVVEIGFNQATDAAAVGVRYAGELDGVERWCWIAAAGKASAVAMTAINTSHEGAGDIRIEHVATGSAVSSRSTDARR